MGRLTPNYNIVLSYVRYGRVRKVTYLYKYTGTYRHIHTYLFLLTYLLLTAHYYNRHCVLCECAVFSTHTVSPFVS